MEKTVRINSDSFMSRLNKTVLCLLATLLVFAMVSCTDEEEEYQKEWPGGTLPGRFSVSASQQVCFSQGNLQVKLRTQTAEYNPTWRFATHQYDFVGNDTIGNVYEDGIKCSNVLGSYQRNELYTGWLDLFGWGTSGWESGARAYRPESLDGESDCYYPGSDYNNDLTGSCARADWGVYNAISNGGGQAGLWRTLTYPEWDYLCSQREGAEEKYGVAAVMLSDGTYINGCVFLPDQWTLPKDCAFTPGVSDIGYIRNVYTLKQWSKMEDAGAVFLPAAGQRSSYTVQYAGSHGYYWSATHYNKKLAYYLYVSSYNVTAYDYHDRAYGRSVRLVKDVD